MNLDISQLLDDWPYEPGKINVRVIQAPDGSTRIQVRLDLGIIQMHATGRPDGERPKGYASLLEFHEAQIDGIEPVENEPPPTEGEELPPFELNAEQCRALREEAVQYYHRYMALMVLEDYDGVIRDTTRNLRLLDLLRDFALEDSDQTAMEQYRPYIMMIRARALASQAVSDNEPKAAIHAIDQGLQSLQAYFDDQGQPELFDQSSEAQMLRGMREALVPKLPVSQKSELNERLKVALDQENYELAAILRDELRLLDQKQPRG